MSETAVRLVDSSVFIFRAYYSVPDHFTSPEGWPTNAVYGFVSTLCQLLEQPDCHQVAVAFDESLESSFRNELYPPYKANREPAPESLKRQFDWCRQACEALGLAHMSHDRYEADDLIGCWATLCHQREQAVDILSTDKDLAQLMHDGDHLVDPIRRRRETVRDIYQRFGVHPHQIADYLALAGDSVDNIPGVPGIGPKAAAALLGHFGNLDALYQRIDEVPYLSFRGAKSAAAKLREHQQAVQTYRQITTILRQVDDIPADFSFQRGPVDLPHMEKLFRQLGFGHGLLNRIQRLAA